MNCEVQHVTENIRYRILIIDEEPYILDMGRSFWKIIFPFFFWMSPNPVFKIGNQAIMEQLKTPKKGKASSSKLVFLAGIAYFLGTLLAPLMEYFEVPISPFFSGIALFFALILVAFLHFSINHKRKSKLYNVVEIETLPENKLWIRPGSTKQVFKVLLIYLWLLAIVLFSFLFYFESKNLMVLIISSGILFMVLLTSRITVEEGQTTVKFKDYKRVV